MRWVEVVLNLPLSGSFFYSIDDSSECKLGLRAEVPFGKRQKIVSYIIAVYEKVPESINYSINKIRPINRIIDKEPVFTEELVSLSRWLSSYYLCSLGEALSIMIPSGRRETGVQGFTFEDDTSAFIKHTLSPEQEEAAHGIISKNGFHYLYGQTGSGKTEVFLTAAENVLVAGKGVIYLVPEIGLTQQVIEAVVKRFGNTAAVLHSGLTNSQRLTEWKRILKKEARVVIGARSAVFAPVPDLGLIIIDEEHDGSYKSGTTPRYHARQVAMRRALIKKIPLVMGSATPSVESWYLMSQKKITKHVLTKRLAGGKLPDIEVVNLSKLQHFSGCISPRLEEEIIAAKSENRQTILFLNRRGFTHFFRCNTCSFDLKCKNCSVSMTYHKAENKLRCHYCGWSIPVPRQCPKCGSLDVTYSGFGTEFIETEIKAKFPSFKVARIDTDSLSDKNDLQTKISSFRKGEIDILLGTQMVAKGLNFPGLKLVGVILADTGLHLPDFRAAERTFSLIVQVTGRAGRFFPDGKVIVQSFNPERAAISFACSGDINGFYKQELEERQILGFPPFSRLLRLVFRSSSAESAQKAAESAADILRELNKHNKSFFYEVMGPSECPLVKISANTRWQILLRSNNIQCIQSAVSYFQNTYKPLSNVYIEVDTDPVSLL